MPDPPPIAAKWGVGGYGLFAANDGRAVFIVSNVGQRVQVNGPTLPLNTFAHVAGVWTGTEAQLYVDGVLLATDLFSGPLPENIGVPLTMGAYDPVYHGGNTASMIGIVDEVKVYGRALSPAEVHAHYTGGSSSDTTAPAVGSTSPTNGATDVAISSTITATFSESMDASTINTTTFTVSDGSSNIGGTVSYSGKQPHLHLQLTCCILLPIQQRLPQV